MEVRYWKQLERHPLSAEYADLKGKPRELFLENLREHGIIEGRKIMLHEGKVLDGWQLYSGCVELEIKPDFKELKLPKGMTVEEWVSTMQDHRRHETQDAAMKRAAERRERVMAARLDGQSERQIAEAEGISPGQVHRDLETLRASGEAVEAETGTVVGKDGKERQATMPTCGTCQGKKVIPYGPQKNAEMIACPQCQPVPADPPLERMREPDEEDEPEPAANGKPKKRTHGKVKNRTEIFVEAGKCIGRLARMVDDLAGSEKPPSRYSQDARTNLQILKKTFIAWGK